VSNPRNYYYSPKVLLLLNRILNRSDKKHSNIKRGHIIYMVRNCSLLVPNLKTLSEIVSINEETQNNKINEERKKDNIKNIQE
jgi:hypothetical protein